MPPAYVKPYIKRQKNDAIDAEAICEAVTRANMRFVPAKTPERQSCLMLHRTRHLFIRQQTAVINSIRRASPWASSTASRTTMARACSAPMRAARRGGGWLAKTEFNGADGWRSYIGVVSASCLPTLSRPELSPRGWGHFFRNSGLKEAALLLKTTLIAAAVAMTVPAYAQQSQRGIRIITPYGEHVYSADPAAPGWLPDDENLRLQNECEQRERVMRQMERDREIERQEELDE
jgi:hypothetical protein